VQTWGGTDDDESSGECTKNQRWEYRVVSRLLRHLDRPQELTVLLLRHLDRPQELTAAPA
jgi:hypothetical protein